MTEDKHVFEVNILSPDGLARAVVASLCGNSAAHVLATIASDWIKQALHRSLDEKPLCLNCDAVWRDDPSWSIVILLPFAEEEGETVTSAICPACAARSDIKSVVLNKMLELCGGGHVLEGGLA
jgi:hypothetical protein